jgi:porin
MQGHLFGDWGGKRSQFEEHGITFDFQYVADHLWNIKSEQPERFASWNRFRGTVDLDLDNLSTGRGPISMPRHSGKQAEI